MRFSRIHRSSLRTLVVSWPGSLCPVRVHSPRWFLILLLALGCALAACSSDSEVADDGDAESSTTTTTTSPAAIDEAVTDEGGAAPVAEQTSSTTTVPELLTDAGVDDREIRIGYSLDLSGPLSAIDATILDAHLAYFAGVNARGGIAGRDVEIIALDHASDLDAHVDNVAALTETGESGVLALGSVGTDELLEAITDRLAGQQVAAVVRGSVSTDQAGQARLLTVGQTTCVDTVAGLSNLAGGVESESPTLAIVTRSDLYGAASAQAARAFAELRELEVVLDARVSDDNTDLIEDLVDSDADLVWVAVSPRELGQLIGAVSGITSEWRWSGAPPSYDASLLQSAAAPILAQRYSHVASIDPYEQEDRRDRAQEIREAISESLYGDADSLAFGWQQAEVLHEALAAAAEAGDMRRAAIAPNPDSVSSGFDSESPTRLFSLDPTVATLDQSLSAAGSTGLVGIPFVEVVDPELLAICD